VLRGHIRFVHSRLMDNTHPQWGWLEKMVTFSISSNIVDGSICCGATAKIEPSFFETGNAHSKKWGVSVGNRNNHPDKVVELRLFNCTQHNFIRFTWCLSQEMAFKKGGGNSTKGAVPLRLSHQGLQVESPISKFENITCLKGCNQEGFWLGNFD
jgi:hypothetical protein